MDHLYIKHNKVLRKIDCVSLLWIKADGNNSIVHFHDTQIVVNISLKQIVAQLPSTQFCQIHRSYVVSLKNIDNIGYDELTVNSEKLPIGKSYRSVLLSHINIIKQNK